ncbi:hypothetical protein V8C44DRAFT_367033 [Trichoderma aethiopicum]
MGQLPGFGVPGAIFMALRLLQLVSLLSVVGLAGSIVRGMVQEKVAVPSAIVGTLVVASIATAYSLTSSILFSQHLLPLLIATAADGTFLIAFIIASCILGKPVHNLSCKTLSSHGNNNNNTGTFISSLFTTTTTTIVVDPSKSACHSIKATWGLSIASTILFFASASIALSLWNTNKRRADRPRKNARSLGTLAMARAQHQRDARRSLYDEEDEDSDDDEGFDEELVPAVHRLLSDRHPYFPPPPAAAKRMKRRTRRPVEEMPPLPPLPAFVTR